MLVVVVCVFGWSSIGFGGDVLAGVGTEFIEYVSVLLVMGGVEIVCGLLGVVCVFVCVFEVVCMECFCLVILVLWSIVNGWFALLLW